MYIELQTRGDAVILPVSAQPGASRDAIRGWSDGALRVAVTQIAEKGKANKSLRRVIAKGLGLRKSLAPSPQSRTPSFCRLAILH